MIVKSIRRCGRVIALTGAVVLGIATPALAQSTVDAPISVRDGELALSALGHVLAVPTPPWLTPDQLTSGQIADLTDLSYATDKVRAQLDMFPKGENAQAWTSAMGARIVLQPALALSEYRASEMTYYAQACKPESSGFFQLEPDTADYLATLGFVCGAFLDTLSGYAGQGEVALIEFKRTKAGLAVVYEKWRGNAFDPAVPSSWPVPTATVEAAAARLKADVSFLAAD